MTQLKLTKNELRIQQGRLAQLERYLPTLQLKKAMLQVEVFSARAERTGKETALEEAQVQVSLFAPLLQQHLAIKVEDGAEVTDLRKRYENIAGVEIPLLERISFAELPYTLFDTPPWVDGALVRLRERERATVELHIAREKLEALEHELRQVSIRVNLFEKVLIPRTLANIKKVKVFLGDQELAAVAQAKVAKAKIEARKQAVANAT